MSDDVVSDQLPEGIAAPADMLHMDIWAAYYMKNYQYVLEKCAERLNAGGYPALVHLAGLALVNSDKVSVGVSMLQAALHLSGVNHDTFLNSAMMALEAKLPFDAIRMARDGIARNPESALLRQIEGHALVAIQRYQEATDTFREAMRLEPARLGLAINLSNSLRLLGREGEALDLLKPLLNEPEVRPLAVASVAQIWLDNGEGDAAVELLRTLDNDALDTEMRFGVGLMYLQGGDYTTGWKLYGERFSIRQSISGLGMEVMYRLLPRRPTLLREVVGKRLLIVSEQGMGDIMQFSRYIPMLAAVAADTQMLVPKTLQPILAETFPQVRHWANQESETDEYDVNVPLLDGPALFGTTLASIPPAIPFQLQTEWRNADRLPPSFDRRRVGICWSGGRRSNNFAATAIDRMRSVHLDQFAPILEVSDCEFLSLQTGPAAHQAAHAALGQVVGDDFSWERTAAIVQQCDLVISVDTAIVHLAALMGVPVWMPSRFMQCWRWLRDRRDSPWYPGLVRVYRQPAWGDYAVVFKEIAADLRHWVDHQGHLPD